MAELKTLVEREMERGGSPSYSLGDLTRRRDRKRRNRRIGSALIALGVAALAIAGVIRAFRWEPMTTPADTITPDNASQLEIVARVDLEKLFPGRDWIEHYSVQDDLLIVQTSCPKDVNDPDPTCGGVAVFPSDCGAGGECEPLWRTPPVGWPFMEPRLEGGVLVAAGHGGRVFGFPVRCTPTDGICEPAWSTRAGLGIDLRSHRRDAFFHSGTFFLGDGRRLLAFPIDCSPIGGVCEPAWGSRPLGRASRVMGVGDVVLVQTEEGRLYGFSPACTPADGVCDPLWAVDAPTLDRETLEVMEAGDRLLFWSWPGVRPILAVSCSPAACATAAWSLPAGFEGSPSLQVDGDLVAVAATNGGRGVVGVFPRSCFGSDRCSPLWRADFPAPSLGQVLVDEGTVVIGASGPGRLPGTIRTFPLNCRTDGGDCPPSGEIRTKIHVHVVRNGVMWGDFGQAAETADGAISAYPVECESPCPPLWASTGLSGYTGFETSANRVFFTPGGRNELVVLGL